MRELARLKELFLSGNPQLKTGMYSFLRFREQEIAEFIDKELLGLIDSQLDENEPGMEFFSKDKMKEEVIEALIRFFSERYRHGQLLKKINGEKRETNQTVELMWAGEDQYFIKTGEFFRPYGYVNRGKEVNFELRKTGYYSARDSYLFPLIDQITLEESKNRIIVPFELRSLKEEEQSKYHSQKEIIKDSVKKIQKRYPRQKALTSGKAGKLSLLEYHLRCYSDRRFFDFFLHRNLRKFLSDELKIFIQEEIIELEKLLNKKASEEKILLGRVINAVGREFIKLLTELENAQIELWEKKKLILKTEYCITVGRLADKFYPEIADNKEQWEEWEKLFSIDDFPEEKNLRIEYLKKNPTLVVDTANFNPDFKERLLKDIPNLEQKLDGILIKGDNFHGLRLLRKKFKEKVRCIYIDPPFNTGGEDFIYQDGYGHNSWLTMMENRIEQAVDFLTSDGTLYVHLDYNEKERLRLLLDRHLFYITEIIWRIGWVSGFKSRAKKFIRNHDTIYQYSKSRKPFFQKQYIPYPPGYTRRDGRPPQGPGYPLEDTWNCSEIDPLNSIQIISFSKEKVGEKGLTQKNENLLARILRSSSEEGDWIMDYFLGSGTTCAAAQKLKRKYIGVEKGEHFYRYALPRMKRVLFGDQYGISKETGWKGGGVFKYQLLETYDEVLDNLELSKKFKKTKYPGYFLSSGKKPEFNLKKLEGPFNYSFLTPEGKKTVDLPETLNNLLGFEILHEKVFYRGENKYFLYEGLKDGKKVLIIWRDIMNWSEEEFQNEEEFWRESKYDAGYEGIYINGKTSIPGTKLLDTLFFELLWS